MNKRLADLCVLQWASVLSRVALEQERMLPVILDLLRTNNDLELRSLTGFLRNMSRHAKDKNDMCKCLGAACEPAAAAATAGVPAAALLFRSLPSDSSWPAQPRRW